MIGGRRVLGLIPARGGSKGLPGKHLRALAGKPLIAWTIEAAKGSACLDRTVLSSDDAAIMETAAALGCEVPFRRPPELASDTASSVDVALHALDALPGYEVLVLLQPTSPLRSAEDIDQALAHMIELDAGSCIAVTEPEESPFWAMGLNAAGRLHPLFDPQLVSLRRQALPPAWLPNGALYAVDAERLRRTRRFLDADTVGFPMPRERSVDIDDALDLAVAEWLLSGQLSHTQP